MEEIVGTALVGTAHRELPPLETDAEVKGLLALLPPDPERRLLLAAGLVSLYTRAGHMPGEAPPIEPAPEETLEPLSKGAADALGAMLQKGTPHMELLPIIGMDLPRSPSGLGAEHDDLLPEALDLLRQRHLRLRHVALPTVLGARPEALHRALLPVIGERGRWLARFNGDWGWVLTMENEAGLSADADALWEEGTLEDRVRVLRQLRRTEPAGARERLAAVFESEPPDARAALLDALEVGLSTGDEPFLEGALDDRHAAVRLRAAGLLAGLPTSACAQRLPLRADSMLTWGRRRRLVVDPPPELDPAWQREGLEPGGGVPGLDPPGAWLLGTARLVPVGHWTERFGVTMERLVGALKGERELEVLEAWTEAAVRFRETGAMPALWDGWWKRRKRMQRSRYHLADMLSVLANGMAPADAGPRLVRLIEEPPPEPVMTCGRVLNALACPWTEQLSDAWVRMLGQIVASVARGEAPPDPWLYALIPGARGVDHAAIAEALAHFPAPETMDGSLRRWQITLEATGEKLALRRRFFEELTR